MNEEALQVLYGLAKGDGYTKSYEDFKVLMGGNSDAVQQMYTLARADGYTKNKSDFDVLVGYAPTSAGPEVLEDPLKKKEDTVSVSEDGLSESQRKSKEIFEQIGRKGFQRVPEEEMPITEQAVAQMDTQFEKPSRAQVGKLESADFTKGRFDFEDAKKVQYTPSEEEVIATDIRLKNPKKKIVTTKDIDSYKEEQEVERKNKERLKGLLLDNYNAVASQQNLEMISPAEYVSLLEDKEDLDGKMFQEFSEEIGDDILTVEEINNINNRNQELIARGEEPVSLDFYINLKRNELFKQYAESKNLLPSQKKQRLIRDIITADSRLLIPSSEIDLTLSLDDETRRANIKDIHKNKLKRDFIIDNISTELYNKNKGRVLTSDSFEEVYNKSLENFYDSYGRQEWEAYKKISGNTDPLLVGTEYENDNKDNSLLTRAVVVGDEDATVQNLKRLFPEFRIEGTGITGDFVTISTVAPDGGVVNSLEIFLGEDNEPEKRIREFMQGALLTKKDKAFLSEDKSESGDLLWRLKMYDYMLSNPQKFGDKNAPSMYGTTRAFETVDFDQINKYLDQYKDNISDKMMAEFRKKMAQADAFYKGELAQKGTLSSAIGAGITEALMSPAKFVSMTGANIYDAFGGEGAKEAKEGLMSAIESSINQISGTTPESIAERDLLQTVLNTMANSATHMALGMGNPYATFGSFLTATAPRTERLLKEEDIPEYQKGLIGLLMGTVEGALETYGAQSLITPATSGMFKNLILTSIKDLPSDASQEAIEQAVRNSVKTKLLSGGLKVAEGMIYEGATEGTQALAEDINKRLFNAIYDKEIFQVPDWTTKEGREQWAEQIVEQVKIGGLAGGGFASVFHGTKSLAKGFDTEAKESVKTFEKGYADIMDDAKFEKAIAEIKAFSASKQITQEQAELLEVELDESREIAQSIPETLSSRRKMEAFNLLKEKRGLQRSMQNKSPELVASQEDRVKEIDGLLKIVGDINVAEETVKEEIDKSRPESIENVTRSEEIENIMTPQEQDPVTEDVVEETTVTEEAPVTEDERAQMREVLGEPAAQEQVVEEAPVVEQVTEEVVQETPVVKEKVTKKKPKKTTTKNLKTQKGVEYKVELDENDKLVSAINPKTGKQIKKFAERKKRDGTTSVYLSSVWSELEAKSIGVITQSQALKERNEKLKKALEATEQPRNAYEAARDFLVRGGQISSESASRETGDSKKVLKWLTRGAKGFTNDSELPSVERASEIIWENSDGELDPQDIRNELIDIIMSTGSRTELADALIEEVEDAEASEFLGSLSPEEMSQYEDILVTEDYLSELTQEQKEEYYKDEIQYYEQEEKRKIETQQLTESVVKDAKTKQRRKKKKPKKQQSKISVEVQKEIDRAERLRDRIVADKTNRLSRTKGFEQKEDLRDDIRQTEKRYNNIITELKEGKRTKFQVKETQEAKTDASRYQEFVSVLRRSFPSVEVVTTQAEFDTLLKETGANELITKDQSVYGAVYQGKLYLNPSLENYNTPIHEFGHVWMNVAKEANPKLYEKGIALVKGSEYEQQVKNNPAYKDSTEQEILEEALATAIGDKGEAFVKESKRKSFKDWLSTLYRFVRKLTGISKYTAEQLDDITLDEFTQAVAVDILSGRQLFEGAEITDMGDALQLMAEKANIKPSMSAQNIIKKARAAEIRDAVIVDYLMSEKDLTRKQAVSAIKRANRGNLKDAVKRLFNNVEDITDIKEKDAQLIKDILKFDRSITRADKMAQKKAKAEIKSRLKAIQRKSKGKLSQAQLLAVTNRFANVNLSSEKSIDSFVDYMQKVFSDVDYAAKMTSLNKSIKQAKKNINSRIGRGADGLAYELRRLLNISPAIIPDSVLEEYSDLVTSFGERKTVLNLKDSTEVKETIAKIFEELSVQNSELGELSERFEAFEDKEFTKTGAVSFAKTVAQMLKDKVITEDEAKLMRKFKSEIMPIEKAEGKTEEEKQKEMEEEKEILIKNIKKSSVNVDRIELAIEKALVKDFARLIKTDAVNDLNNAQLKNIEKAIDNINNGYVTHYVQLASENLESINRSKTGAEGIRDAKPLAVSTQIAKIKTLYKSGSDANKFYKLIERNPLINIDMVLGDFSSKRIFNSVLEESAEAVTTFNTELNKVYNTIEDAEVQLQKKFKNNGNKILESKYKQMAYMVQQEFESNPNNPQVNPAAEVIEATIKKLRDSNQSYEAGILQEILKNYSTDGQIDLKKLDDSFVYAELNMIKTVQDINSKLTDKATYTASVIRGESIEPLNDYIHQSVLNTDGVAVDDSRALSENYMENIKPSTKAKNLIERTKGAKAINFDITASVRRGAKMTLMDYHLTAPLRTANRTLNKMEEQLDNTGQQRQIFLGVRDAYNQAIADVLENTFTSSSIGEQIFQYAAKQGYRSMLASVPRVFGELLSNYSFALINPVEFTEGSKPKNMKVAFSERGVEVMNNVRSKETARVYGEGLSGRFVETSMIEKKMGMAADSAKNPVVNRVNQALSYLKKYPRGVEVIADFMITTPDKLVTRPMWFGTFATEFKNITGEEVNFDKIAENDTAYMEKFEKAINEAKKKADSNSVLIGATDNPLQGILKNKKRASDKASIIKTINSFMQRFLLFEYNAFRKGMYAAMGRGDISPGKGALLMTAVSARMTMYTLMIPILNSLMFGDDDEEKEESIYTRVYRALLSTATNLFIGRDFGAIVKMVQNYFIEQANERYGEDLGIREGEYDPFKNLVQYNIIPPEKSYKETDVASDILPNLFGPYTPLLKSLIFSTNKLFFSKPKKEEDAKERQRREIQQRIPLEIGGLTGLIPFYRDFRNRLNEDIYQGLRDKSSGDSGDSGDSKSSSDTRKPRKIMKLRKLRKLRKLKK